MRTYLQGVNDLDVLIPDGSVVKPPGSEDIHAAWASLNDVFGEGQFRRDIQPWMVLLAGSTKDRVLRPEELMQLRDLLRTGARIATACCALDDTLSLRAQNRTVTQRAFDWFARRTNATFQATERYLHARPFQDYHPQFLRIELDKWAQRIDLRTDGSPLVFMVCEREALARKVLDSGPYHREVSLKEGVVCSRLVVRDERDGSVVLESEHKVKELFSILSLAQSASQLLQDLQKEGVDIARLCAMSHRDAFVGMSLCLTKISPQTHIHLDSVDFWAPRFDVQRSSALSYQDVAELGALLLDAEAVLYTVSHLREALFRDSNVSLWLSKWKRGIYDKECRAALRLVNERRPPLDCNCDQAGEIAATAALILGYSSDERVGSSWNVPESPLQSVAWILDNGLDQRRSAGADK
jgi:hypothetical protein